MFIRSFMLHAYVPPPTLIIFKYSKDGGKVIHLFQTTKLGAWGSWFLAKLTNMLINRNNFICVLHRMCYFQHFSVGIVPPIHSIVMYCNNIISHIYNIVTCYNNIVPHIHGFIVHPVLPFCICLWPGSAAPLAHLKICKSFLSVLSDHKVLFDYDRWAGRCF